MKTDTFDIFLKLFISYFEFGYKFVSSSYTNSNKALFMIKFCIFFFKKDDKIDKTDSFCFPKQDQFGRFCPILKKKIKS